VPRVPGPPRACIVRQMAEYEPMVQREAEALAGAGFDVEIICMREPGRPWREVINGVTLIRLPARRHNGGKARYLADYGSFFALATAAVTARHLRRPYAVVQVKTMPDFLVFAAAVPRLLGSKLVAYMHEPTPELAETLFGPGWLPRLLATVEQRALRFADHAVTVTDQLKQRYVERGAAAEKITVVLNCADPATMRPGTAGAAAAGGTAGFTVVCHGTMQDRYGQDTIVTAAGLLKAEMPDLRVVLTGRGAFARMLADAVAEQDLQDVVRLAGWVSREQLAAILGSADVGVVAQKSSPYSDLVHTNKMVDYWIFGLPVIASRLRAVAAYYGDDVLEFFEPGDPASLAAAIRRLRADPRRRALLAEAGLRAQAEHGWAAQRPVYLGVFTRLLAAPAGSAARPRAQAGGLMPGGQNRKSHTYPAGMA
jgi:glycosyltransferase involved in cell wall biosynthesis